MRTLSTAHAFSTHAGRRRSNQDAVVVSRLGNGAELVAVADGMGGHSAGEVASAMALEALVAGLEAGATLAEAFAEANRLVHQAAKDNVQWQGMGTTLVALLRTGDDYVVANVGDSRAYAVDSNGIRQLTDDHSYVAEARRAGVMTEAQLASSPWRNALTRSIGTDPTVQVDVFGPFSTVPPHAVLLCSDGLYKAVSETVVREYVLSLDDLTQATEVLTALAYRRGSDDNISVAVAEFASLPRRSPTVTLPLPIRIAGERQPARQPSVAPPAAPPPPEQRFVPAPRPPARAPAPEVRRRRRGSRRSSRGLQRLLAVLVLATVVAATLFLIG